MQSAKQTSAKNKQVSIKASPKQATQKSSKKLATPQKTSPNSRENRKVGNTATDSAHSVARWLSPKPAKFCREKLPDPAENHFTKY